LVALDPTLGSEISKTRPGLIVSPDEMNRPLATVLIAPMTTTVRSWPSRINVRFDDVNGQVALDQLRAVSRQRLVRRLGRVKPATMSQVLACLQTMFSP
jgi:mRNA interferase MazF